MASITYSLATYSILSLEPIQKISSDLRWIDIVEELILEKKVKDSDEVYLNGWMAYQFDPEKNRITSEPISSSRIKDGKVLVSTYLVVKPKPIPNEIYEIIEDNNTPKVVKKLLMKVYSKSIFNDFIFVEGNPKLWVVIPTKDTDWIVENILNPTFGERFTVNYANEVQIPMDLLLWLMFKVKKRNNGNLGIMRINRLVNYGAMVRGTGKLDVEDEEVESNLFTQISAGIGNDCEHLMMSIYYKGRDYTFFLYEGTGKFCPVWNAFQPLNTGSYKMDRVLDVITIATEIIPAIVREYRNDINWSQEKINIFQQELSEAKNKLP